MRKHSLGTSLGGRGARAAMIVMIVTMSFIALATASAGEPSAGDLCKLLTPEEVSAIVGSRHTSRDSVGGCVYETPSSRAIHLTSSSDATSEEYVEEVKNFNGEILEGPDGAVMSSVGSDLLNEKISEVWFAVKGVPLQMVFDGGLDADEAAELVEAARE